MWGGRCCCQSCGAYSQTSEQCQHSLPNRIGLWWDDLHFLHQTDPDPQILVPLHAMEFSYTVAPHLGYFNIPFAEFTASRPEFDSFAVGGYIFSPTKLSGHGSASQRHVLLLQRAETDSMPGCWEGPGGASESDDKTLLDGVAREVFEETGLHVSKIAELVGVDSWTHTRRRDGFKFRIVKYSFIVEVYDAFTQLPDGTQVPVATEDIPVRLEATEHQRFEWATEEEVRISVQTGQGKYKLPLPSTGHQGPNILRSFELAEELDTNKK